MYQNRWHQATAPGFCALKLAPCSDSDDDAVITRVGTHPMANLLVQKWLLDLELHCVSSTESGRRAIGLNVLQLAARYTLIKLRRGEEDEPIQRISSLYNEAVEIEKSKELMKPKKQETNNTTITTM